MLNGPSLIPPGPPPKEKQFLLVGTPTTQASGKSECKLLHPDNGKSNKSTRYFNHRIRRRCHPMWN